jgi:CubicO group peptidase (beta-lactamase class C family)
MNTHDTVLRATEEAVSIEGYCAPEFSELKAAFAESFVNGGELGASLAIEIDGRVAVDLWGGWMDRREACGGSATPPAWCFPPRNRPRRCARIYSRSRAHSIWTARQATIGPRFALDKRDITTRMLLDHTAGRPALREPLPDDAAFDWDHMVWRLERETPFWAPGTRVAYHGMTFGWLVGEIVRRVGGCSLGKFFARHVAQPLALDFCIGLPEHEERRVATIVPPERLAVPRNARERDLCERPDSPAALFMKNTGGWRRRAASRMRAALRGSTARSQWAARATAFACCAKRLSNAPSKFRRPHTTMHACVCRRASRAASCARWTTARVDSTAPRSAAMRSAMSERAARSHSPRRRTGLASPT